MLYIGIDLGTSAMKLLLMDAEGQIKNVVSKEYPLEFPQPGWSQQMPEDWAQALMEGIPQLLHGFDGASVAGIGAGGQMHGLVVLDKDDKVIRPAILWNDGRTAKQVDYLNNEIGKDKLSQLTANIAFAGFHSSKDPLDAGKRAGEFRAHRKNHAPQGLHQLYSDRCSCL